MGARYVFVLEQELGHRVHADNLMRAASARPDIDAHAVEVGQGPARWAHGVPGLGSWSVRASWQTRAALRSPGLLPADALYLHSQVTSLLSVRQMLATPSVISLDATPRNYDSLAASYGHRVGAPAVERAKLWCNRRAMLAARAVVAFSEWAATSVVEDYGVPAASVAIIPSGVDVQRYRPAAGQRRPGPVRILFVGGDFERKGGPDLLAACGRLGASVELDIVSSGLTQVAAAPRVRVHGAVRPDSQELIRLYQEADVFAFPSHGDCSPRAVTEAMACGLPVVACPVGAVAELVQDGRTGHLVPVADVDALTAALTRLVGSPGARARMGAEARRDAMVHHDAERNAQAVFELMGRCAAGAGRVGAR